MLCKTVQEFIETGAVLLGNTQHFSVLDETSELHRGVQVIELFQDDDERILLCFLRASQRDGLSSADRVDYDLTGFQKREDIIRVQALQVVV